MSRPDWILKGKEFYTARNAVPLVDVEEIRKRAGEEIKQHNDDILRAMLVKLRWTNPICDGCQKKDPDTIRLLKRCGRYVNLCCDIADSAHTTICSDVIYLPIVPKLANANTGLFTNCGVVNLMVHQMKVLNV